MTVFERIKLEADKKGISLTLLAEKANLSPGAINKWTSNSIEEFKGEPGAIKLFRVAEELECTMEYLLTGIKKYDSLSSSDIEWLEILQLLNQIPEKQNSECKYFVEKYIQAYIEFINTQDKRGI